MGRPFVDSLIPKGNLMVLVLFGSRGGSCGGGVKGTHSTGEQHAGNLCFQHFMWPVSLLDGWSVGRVAIGGNR